MEMSHEAEVTNLSEVRRARAIENSPFGPVKKFGEAMMRDQVEIESTDHRLFLGSQHVYSEVIRGHGAAERTDVSDPRHPYYDM